MENKSITPVSESTLIQLSDNLGHAQIMLARARCVLSDVTDTFFNFDPNARDDRVAIRFSFKEYQTKTDIASDYIFRAFKEIQEQLNIIRNSTV